MNRYDWKERLGFWFEEHIEIILNPFWWMVGLMIIVIVIALALKGGGGRVMYE